MNNHKTGCLICGKELKYFDPAKILKCEICKAEFEAAASCEDEHFVCDACHSQEGYAHITSFALRTEYKNPVITAGEMMKSDFINMHGPEHHYLIVAALLSAYKNSGGSVDLNKSLNIARQRAKNVPGGICGMWGCCGAGIGAGIFVSIITGATPLSFEEWGLSNKMTSQSLDLISQNGGPRCCKRNTFLSILRAIDFTTENLGVEMEKPQNIQCSFFMHNPSCKKEHCLFYPHSERAEQA